MPPPPAAAFRRSGKPFSRPKVAISAADAAGVVMPGTTGTPAASIRWRDSVLLPIAPIENGLGPTHVRPASITAWANAAFSERKPKPGWIIVAPVLRAAAMSFSGTR